MNAFPFISFIIVDYNGTPFLKDCLVSLYDQDYPKEKIEIIVIDNGSSGDSERLIAGHYPRVRYFKNSINNYCAANNLGIKKSKGEFIALVNNDAKLKSVWLKEMLRVMLHHKKAGAACGKVLFPDGRIQGTGHLELPNFYWADRGFKEEEKGQYSQVEQINSISHCAAIFRRDCIRKAGLLDEDFIMYLEDVDISLRIGAQGWELFYVPLSIAYHKFHGSIDDASVEFLCERNRLLLLAKHFPEKLPDALFGKGFFARTQNGKGLLSILPLVLDKLSKHHDVEMTRRLLPEIFAGAEKILSYEKDSLIKRIADGQEQLESYKRQRTIEIGLLKEEIERKEKDVAVQGSQLTEKEALLQEVSAELAVLKQRCSRAEQEIIEKEQGISLINEQLLCKERTLKEALGEILGLKNQLNQIYDSETYRFVAKPLWKILDFFKGKRIVRHDSRGSGIIVIKPFCAGIGDTLQILRQLRQSNHESRIAIFAHVLAPDYQMLVNNEFVQDRYVFSPDINRLTMKGLCKALVRIRGTRYDQAIVLVGEPVYQGYWKAKLFAFFCGARQTKFHFIRPTHTESHETHAAIRYFGKTMYSVLRLSLFVFLFIICIVIPLKLKKIFQR
ncbi:MAG: glycosyltransferase [Candidatus Omnitrophota bacterium]|jgi:GT2 family glycosyltransferase|nr:MAG: glycosyltransferase [Candidatus Omnitrophota bacterium]